MCVLIYEFKFEFVFFYFGFNLKVCLMSILRFGFHNVKNNLNGLTQATHKTVKMRLRLF